MNEGMKMMRRIYGFLAAALCFGLVSCILVGCFFGGGDEPTTAPTQATQATVAPETTTSEVTDTTGPDTETTVPGVTTTTEIPELVDGLPAPWVESIGNRPVVVLFYVSGGVDDEKVLASLRELTPLYSNYTFLMYDYRLPDAYGDLADLLKVDYPPHMVLLDRNGLVRTVWSGFVDKGTLNQTLLTLGRY